MRDGIAITLASLFLLAVLFTLSFLSYRQMSQDIISDIDKRLFVGAAAVKHLLPPNFHARPMNPHTISKEADNHNIAMLSQFAAKADFKFLYTLIKIDNDIYITSSSATEEEMSKNEQVRYFTLFNEADAHFVKAFDTQTPASFTHSDRWGTFRAVLLPEITPDGRKYLSVAEQDISYIKEMLRPKALESLATALFLILGALPLFYLFLKRGLRVSEKQKKMEKQLRQAQKMESVGRLAGGVAHDYNNISSIIIGYCELAIERVDRNDPLHDDLLEILSAAHRSTEITRQLLAFARKQTIAPRVLNVNDTLANMMKMLSRLIGEDINLTFLPGENIQAIKIDPSQIDQILANLCVNSRDAIKNVGSITIETSNITLTTDYCKDHTGFFPGEYVMIAVSDDGSGITPEAMDQIFEPFFTTKSPGKGTGLGLATIYGIVKQNKGFVNAYSEPGKGTTIRIYLPRHYGEATSYHIKKMTEFPQSHGETIFIVEDAPAILKLGKKMLCSLGYNVLSCASPNEAIRLAGKYKEKIHLLITDVVMPEMNGRELSEKFKSLCPGLKVLFMSGYTANVIAHRGVLDDGVNFISKPFSKKDLALKIRQVLDDTGDI